MNIDNVNYISTSTGTDSTFVNGTHCIIANIAIRGFSITQIHSSQGSMVLVN